MNNFYKECKNTVGYVLSLYVNNFTYTLDALYTKKQIIARLSTSFKGNIECDIISPDNFKFRLGSWDLSIHINGYLYIYNHNTQEELWYNGSAFYKNAFHTVKKANNSFSSITWQNDSLIGLLYLLEGRVRQCVIALGVYERYADIINEFISLYQLHSRWNNDTLVIER